jgi:hypothetical protein
MFAGSPTLPLLLATGAFLAVLIWRVRPQLGWGRQAGASRREVREAKARIEATKNDAERARALCDAADLLAPASAEGYFLRAVRAAPTSTEVIERVVAGLGKKPRILESVLWRHLAVSPWADTRAATLASLRALVSLYEGPLHDPTSARVLKNAAETLDSKP